MSLNQLKQQWEELAKMDPFWAIITDPTRQFGKWEIDEFFDTGKHEARNLMESAKMLPPRGHGSRFWMRCGQIDKGICAAFRAGNWCRHFRRYGCQGQETPRIISKLPIPRESI